MWGSENTHKIRSAFFGMAPGKPLCMTLINSLFLFFELCFRCVEDGKRSCSQVLLTARHMRSHCRVLEKAYCDRQSECSPGDV
jgi:hypothetical protein